MKYTPVFFIALVLNYSSLEACLWDSDTMAFETLASESARFPNVSAMLTGNFARHSKEFHAWRAADRLKLVEANTAEASDYDDLAVSQHKMGDHKAAIATMKQKEKLMPGIYETYSNLGTFYIYTGELSEALVFIKRALDINPNAHFGREKYQKWLVLWILENRESGAIREASQNDPRVLNGVTRGFASFVARQESQRKDGSPILTRAQQQAAVHGLTGMMYFADFDNPILLEALGDLLLAGKKGENASRLAGLCYLHASQKVKNPDDQERLNELSRSAIRLVNLHGEELEPLLKNALFKGQQLNAGIRDQEMAWIAAGKDVSAEFQKKYLSAAK
ncbi:MAG: tetratricopeptide repeat protein [Verrucomicrobia bacterium]|nr:tetratricopeptide repeat protein [Verrucomicrobiota bacterium]